MRHKLSLIWILSGLIILSGCSYTPETPELSTQNEINPPLTIPTETPLPIPTEIVPIDAHVIFPDGTTIDMKNINTQSGLPLGIGRIISSPPDNPVGSLEANINSLKKIVHENNMWIIEFSDGSSMKAERVVGVIIGDTSLGSYSLDLFEETFIEEKDLDIEFSTSKILEIPASSYQVVSISLGNLMLRLGDAKLTYSDQYIRYWENNLYSYEMDEGELNGLPIVWGQPFQPNEWIGDSQYVIPFRLIEYAKNLTYQRNVTLQAYEVHYHLPDGKSNSITGLVNLIHTQNERWIGSLGDESLVIHGSNWQGAWSINLSTIASLEVDLSTWPDSTADPGRSHIGVFTTIDQKTWYLSTIEPSEGFTIEYQGGQLTIPWAKIDSLTFQAGDPVKTSIRMSDGTEMDADVAELYYGNAYIPLKLTGYDELGIQTAVLGSFVSQIDFSK